MENDQTKCAEANCCNYYDQGTCSSDYVMWKTNEACATPSYYQYACAKSGSSLGQIAESTNAGEPLTYLIIFLIFIGIILAGPTLLALSVPFEILRIQLLSGVLTFLIGLFSPVILSAVFVVNLFGQP